jgi:glycosyltransferase involved in cell wall biosynthesis
MRILHVIESMQMGGAERHLANLLGPLADLGVTNEVVTLWSGLAYESSVLPFARVHDLGLRPRRALPAILPLARLAREVDVVNTQLPWADIVGRVAAAMARKPSVTTLQTTWYDPANLASFTPPIRRNVERIRRVDAFTARLARRFFAVSEATRQVYIKGLGVPAHKIQVIPNTVDLGQFNATALRPRDELRAALGCAENELALIMVARLVTPKGHADAIAAVARLRDELPLKLYIVGTGPEEERLKRLAAERQAPVVFLGPRSDVPSLLRVADLFLFPSIIEGMPLALIEAMAMGLACLCSDIPENRETGAEAIAYAPPGNVDELTKALRAILTDGDTRRRLASAAPMRASRYSSRTVAAELLRSIEDVLGRRRSSSDVVTV